MSVKVFKIVRALCLDMDGTIRHSKSGKTHINGPDDVALYADVEPLLLDYSEKNWLVALISNQGGVAHGFKTINQVEAENQRTTQLFTRNPIDYVFYCPFDPTGTVPPFNQRSQRRKPETGMLVSLEDEAYKTDMVIDWHNSLFVGDRNEDRLCATVGEMRFEWAWHFFGRKPPPGQGIGHGGPGPVLPE